MRTTAECVLSRRRLAKGKVNQQQKLTIAKYGNTVDRNLDIHARLCTVCFISAGLSGALPAWRAWPGHPGVRGHSSRTHIALRRLDTSGRINEPRTNIDLDPLSDRPWHDGCDVCICTTPWQTHVRPIRENVSGFFSTASFPTNDAKKSPKFACKISKHFPGYSQRTSKLERGHPPQTALPRRCGALRLARSFRSIPFVRPNINLDLRLLLENRAGKWIRKNLVFLGF